MATLEMMALTSLSRELSALADPKSGTVPGYRKLWQMVVDGRLPAEQVNGRYQVRRADLPAILGTLGLQERAVAPARGRVPRKAPPLSPAA